MANTRASAYLGRGMLDAAHVAAVRALVSALPPEQHLWALTGSAGLRLQGVAVEVHDLDVQTDRATANAIVDHFRTRVRTPLHERNSEILRSAFARLDFDGLVVEVMGDVARRWPESSWEAPVDVSAVRVWVAAHGLAIPVMSLEHEWRAYVRMGRTEKAALIRQVLDARSAGAGAIQPPSPARGPSARTSPGSPQRPPRRPRP